MVISHCPLVLSAPRVLTLILINLGFSSKYLEGKRKMVITLIWWPATAAPGTGPAPLLLPQVCLFHSFVIVISIGLLSRGHILHTGKEFITCSYITRKTNAVLKSSLQRHLFCMDLKCVKMSNLPVHHQSWLFVSIFCGQGDCQQSAGPEGWWMG